MISPHVLDRNKYGEQGSDVLLYLAILSEKH